METYPLHAPETYSTNKKADRQPLPFQKKKKKNGKTTKSVSMLRHRIHYLHIILNVYIT